MKNTQADKVVRSVYINSEVDRHLALYARKNSLSVSATIERIIENHVKYKTQ